MSERHASRRTVLGAIGGVLAASSGIATADDDGSQTDGLETDERYVDVYEETIESVVLVQVSGSGPGEAAGFGSGFVYDETHVVTNEHVVGDADTVELRFADGEWRSATVVGTDRHSDLAVVEVDTLPEGTEPLAVAEEQPTVAQEVIALGNPLGLDASVSAGVVSGVDRSLPSPTGFPIPAAIQTDAPVNPGNSGGPLVNLDGEVVGVVLAGAGPGFNVGFAISSRLLERVVPSLLEQGTYNHPHLGVSAASVTPSVAEANDLEEIRGAMVVETVPDSPADGVFQPATDTTFDDGPVPVPVGGDVIVAVSEESDDPSNCQTQSDGDSVTISDVEQLTSYLALETNPDESIEIEVIRDGQVEVLEVTLGVRPDQPPSGPPRPQPDEPPRPQPDGPPRSQPDGPRGSQPGDPPGA